MAELKRRVHLLSFGNGMDLCFMPCRDGVCVQQILTARIYSNLSEKGMQDLPNGAIEISSKEQTPNFIANNANGCWCDVENKIFAVFCTKQGMLVIVRG